MRWSNGSGMRSCTWPDSTASEQQTKGRKVATLDTQVIGLAGTAINLVAATVGGDACATGDDVKLLVKNGSGVSINVTLVTPGTVDGDLAIADRIVAVAAGAMEGIKVTDRYRDPSTGLASFTYSAVTTVTVGVIR